LKVGKYQTAGGAIFQAGTVCTIGNTNIFSSKTRAYLICRHSNAIFDQSLSILGKTDKDEGFLLLCLIKVNCSETFFRRFLDNFSSFLSKIHGAPEKKELF
jgi:hypothetical protein